MNRRNPRPKQDGKGRFCAQTLREKFEAKVIKGDGCWAWNGAKHKNGYGELWHGRRIRATHACWELHVGKVPKGLHVLHHCDNPPCTNPKHLFLGTQGANMKDKTIKSRAARKLTANDAVSIRSAYRNGIPSKLLAQQFKVSTVTVLKIARGETWRHI